MLNADDPLVLGMADRTPGDVVLFSAAPDGGNAKLEEHVAAGGAAASIEDGEFVIRQPAPHSDRAGAEVPLTLNGLARFQFGNVLAAISRRICARDALRRYPRQPALIFPIGSSDAGTPAICYAFPAAACLSTRAHNAAAVEGLLDFNSRLDVHRQHRRHYGPRRSPRRRFSRRGPVVRRSRPHHPERG